MSIDAKIELVTYEPDGTVQLHLGPRDPKVGPAGQSVLTVLNPKSGMEVLEGMCIWGGDSSIMVGDKELGRRESYTTIRLTEPRQQPPSEAKEEPNG